MNLVLDDGFLELHPRNLFFRPAKGSEGEVEFWGDLDALDELPFECEIKAILYQIILPSGKFLTFAHDFSEPVIVLRDEDGMGRLVCMDSNLVGWYKTAEIFEDEKLRGEVTQFEA